MFKPQAKPSGLNACLERTNQRKHDFCWLGIAIAIDYYPAMPRPVRLYFELVMIVMI